MSIHASIRQIHRWLSVAFTVGTLANVVAMSRGAEAPAWVGAMAFVPLMILFASGLYLLVWPYVVRWRSGRTAEVRGAAERG